VPKMVQIGLAGVAGRRGEIYCSTGLFFHIFILFLSSSGEHIFKISVAFSALDDVFRWELIS